MNRKIQKANKVSLREVEEKADGYSYKTFLARWREDGKDRKKRFKDQMEAEAFILTKQVELGNKDAVLHNAVTRLSPGQIHEAESAFQRLGERYSLTDAVEFFLSNFTRPDFTISIADAVKAFLEGKEKDGVRPRSIVQLESSLRQFEAFAFIRGLADGEQVAIATARTTLAKRALATPEEIARRMPKEHRAQFRNAVRATGETSPSILPDVLAALPTSVRNAAADTREEIEAKRTPSDWQIVAEIRGTVSEPELHTLTTPLVEAFLRSLRGKDGVSDASRKTWNNSRADLHSFFSWCADSQRRWLPNNPASPIVKYKINRGIPDILSLGQCEALMQHVAGFEKGALVPYFALALFAGLRTGDDGELQKLAKHTERGKLIDLENGVIHIQPEISKTGQYRQVKIRENLSRWLVAYPLPILPVNHSNLIKSVRAHFKLTHDILRHTFFSMHIAAFDSVGRAALEGGNTEGIIRRHYLNMTSQEEGNRFWNIEPNTGEKIIKFAQ
jgi:site-specific recombinase XerD